MSAYATTPTTRQRWVARGSLKFIASLLPPHPLLLQPLSLFFPLSSSLARRKRRRMRKETAGKGCTKNTPCILFAFYSTRDPKVAIGESCGAVHSGEERKKQERMRRGEGRRKRRRKNIGFLHERRRRRRHRFPLPPPPLSGIQGERRQTEIVSLPRKLKLYDELNN